MAEVQSIHPADLRAIENRRGRILEGVGVVGASVDTVNDNVQVVYDEVGSRAKDFHEFVVAAWINNQQELAEKALREGIKRNDEKESERRFVNMWKEYRKRLCT